MYAGVFFSAEEITLIRNLVSAHYVKGRTFISTEICKAINWRQPNGWLKDRACRDVLRYFEAKGYFKLPEPKVLTSNTKPLDYNPAKILDQIDTTNVNSVDFRQVRFQQVKGTKKELLWNVIVNEYHYLGFKIFVGRSLKYLITYKGQILAAIGWCDPAWSINARNIPLKKIGFDIGEIRYKGVNNGRFLIMPWVNVPNLASYLLSRAMRVLVTEWYDFYSVKPLYAETFVDPIRFAGTCYLASNWTLMGESQGYRKIGLRHENGGSRKLFFLYPLDKKLKRDLQKIFK